MNEVTINLASRGARLGGALLDSLIMMVVMIPLMLFMGVLQNSFAGIRMTFNETVIVFFVGWAVFLGFNGYLLYKKGQTIGKVIVKTKIVDLNGKLPEFGKMLLLRYVVLGVVTHVPILGSLAAIVNVLFIFGNERRCLHDYLAGTRVVNC